MEIRAPGPGDPAVELVQSDLFEIAPIATIPEKVERFKLGIGELGVIALGLETKGAIVVLDDLAARRSVRHFIYQCAERCGWQWKHGASA